MARGTKIILAVAALLAVLLVMYYRSGTPERVAAQMPAADPQSQVAQPRRAQDQPSSIRPRVRAPIEPQPAPVDDSTRLLRESIERAIEAEKVEPQEDVRPVASRSDQPLDFGPTPMIVDPTDDAGGKDGPIPQPMPTAESAGDETAGPLAPSTPIREETVTPAPTPLARPGPRTPTTPTPTPPPTVEYIVKQDDTMSSISTEWFGDASKWDLIARANPLVDPDRLRIGQVLRLPPKDAQREEGRPAAPITGSADYIVQSGDTLSRIATAYYGSAAHWQLIYNANRTTIGDDPGRLRVGMRLTIPPRPAPRPTTN